MIRFINFFFQFKNTSKKCICHNQLGNKIDEVEKGVYVINCDDCNLSSYVGEMSRQFFFFSVCLEEHSRAVRSNDRKSDLAVHCWDGDHHMNFKDGTIIYRENNEKRSRGCYH